MASATQIVSLTRIDSNDPQVRYGAGLGAAIFILGGPGCISEGRSTHIQYRFYLPEAIERVVGWSRSPGRQNIDLFSTTIAVGGLHQPLNSS